MPQTSDPSPKALPNQELNPLLNPLLAENMNRWAEVYFNNPPERREQAVLDLLRELQAQHALQEAAAAAPRATFQNAPLADVSTVADHSGGPPTAGDDLLRCGRCGRDNPLTHKFCGMCGEILHPKQAAVRQNAAALEYAEPAYPNENKKKEAVVETRTEAELEPEPASESYEEHRQAPVRSIGELSLFQSAPREYENYDEEDGKYESSHSPSYRFYIGGLLAIVLLALGYAAWRASHNSQTSDEPSPAPPATIPAANANATNSAAATPAVEKLGPKSSGPAGTHTSPNQADAGVADSAKAESRAPKQSTGGGNEELAQAERYLDAANGDARDTATAAQWLWKSIAKHNGRATLLLADLYLKGDGVSKNCDQARVLLDSAARNGVAGAGERLRNLQAFGCQ